MEMFFATPRRARQHPDKASTPKVSALLRPQLDGKFGRCANVHPIPSLVTALVAQGRCER